MDKASFTYTVAGGKVNVLYAGLSVEDAMEAFKGAKGTVDGEVCVVRKPIAYRRWKGEKTAQPASKTAPKKYSRKGSG